MCCMISLISPLKLFLTIELVKVTDDRSGAQDAGQLEHVRAEADTRIHRVSEIDFLG